jgi:hypothetical protein
MYLRWKLSLAQEKVVPIPRRRDASDTKMEIHLTANRYITVSAAKQRVMLLKNNLARVISLLIQVVPMDCEAGIFKTCRGKWSKWEYK